MKIADYYNKCSQKDMIGLKGNLKINTNEQDFSIQLLDNIIQVEEQMYGFSLYNRGNDLKKSLIDPSRVQSFISKYQNPAEQ